MDNLKGKIEELRPWRYNHRHGDIIIKANDEKIASYIDNYGSDILKQILNNICKHLPPVNELRVLDLGCLEGHYSDILCDYGFKEVVSVDLSDKHIERATFWLHSVKKHKNSTIVMGNVLDQDLICSLGKFDIIFFQGLLYHLSSPVMAFDIIEKIIRDKNNFFLLLTNQFHMDYRVMASPMASGELRVRKFEADEKGHVLSPKDESVFDVVSLRLNPIAIYSILKSYKYKEIIAYDRPSGTKAKNRNFSVSCVLSKKEIPTLVDDLNKYVTVDDCKFYPWDGTSIDGYVFHKDLKYIFVNILYKIMNKVIIVFNRLGK